MSNQAIEITTTADGRQLYTIQVEAFPNFIANVYLINNHGSWVLVDCGSGGERSNRDLVAGLSAIGEQSGHNITFADIDLILLTHGHMDHFGGLPFLRQHTDAPAAIHALDLRAVSFYEERRMLDGRRTLDFAAEAGVSDEQQERMRQMHQQIRGNYYSHPVQHVLTDGQVIDNIQVHHTPGHSAGQVCYQVDDVLLTADHILHSTTPHQAPETIHPHSGLGHYLEALDKIAQLTPFKIGLGGHEAPIQDVHQRIEDIKQFHYHRLDKVRQICQERPKTVQQVSKELFGSQSGFHVWLALEEAGAHVEYLFLRGELSAANAEHYLKDGRPVIEYKTV